MQLVGSGLGIGKEKGLGIRDCGIGKYNSSILVAGVGVDQTRLFQI
jgi:hypothetical protein